MRLSQHPHLYRWHVVGVLTDDLRLRRLLDLGQLLKGERRREAGVFEPKAIAAFDVGEVACHYACECRSDQGTKYQYINSGNRKNSNNAKCLVLGNL